MEKKFKIYYDDQPNDVVDRISTLLYEFGLIIRELDGGDGWVEYEIGELNIDLEAENYR